MSKFGMPTGDSFMIAEIKALEAENERLRRFEHCFAAQPGETTLECRHDNLCPYCQF